MNQAEYRFQFRADVDVREAQSTLNLSLLAAEGVHGEARVRTEVASAVDVARAEARVSGNTPALDTVAQVYTALLSHEFGRDAFTVRREPRAAAVAA